MKTEVEVRNLIEAVIFNESSKTRSISSYEINLISKRLIKLLKNDGNLKFENKATILDLHNLFNLLLINGVSLERFNMHNKVAEFTESEMIDMGYMQDQIDIIKEDE